MGKLVDYDSSDGEDGYITDEKLITGKEIVCYRNSPRNKIRSYFMEIGYSPGVVEKALNETDSLDENTIFQFIMNAEENGSTTESSESMTRNHFLSMGYSSTLVDKAISECGSENQAAVLESILTHQQLLLTTYFVNMGHSSAIVEKAIVDCGTEDEDRILEHILTYEILDNPQMHTSPSESASNDSDNDQTLFDSGISDESGIDAEISVEPSIKKQLLEMGFVEDEVSSALNLCGFDTPLCTLIDSIYAMRYSSSNDINEKVIEPDCISFDTDLGNGVGCLQLKSRGIKRNHLEDSFESRLQKRLKGKAFKYPEMKISSQKTLSNDIENLCFNPSGVKVNEFLQGPPYFYFENVAIAPKGSWETMSRFLHGIKPELVDSKNFSVSCRKRGYIHNLPRTGRFRALPLPPMTIREALPETQKYWPTWDRREKLNCINTALASVPLCERLRAIIQSSNGGSITYDQQEAVLRQCKKWNLVWVGYDQLAPLEPHEIELVLGFDKDHTRGATNRTQRIKSLGNAFQVDTVAYHFSVLKDLFPNGINVLSLFSGIGGAEVALHKLGVPLNCVVSAEKCKENVKVLRNWWDKTNQKGRLIEVGDVENLSIDRLEELMQSVGGFDLIVGGSPCNNLTGSNRSTRDGLEGEYSSLFFEFSRIFNIILQFTRFKN